MFDYADAHLSPAHCAALIAACRSTRQQKAGRRWQCSACAPRSAAAALRSARSENGARPQTNQDQQETIQRNQRHAAATAPTRCPRRHESSVRAEMPATIETCHKHRALNSLDRLMFDIVALLRRHYACCPLPAPAFVVHFAARNYAVELNDQPRQPERATPTQAT